MLAAEFVSISLCLWCSFRKAVKMSVSERTCDEINNNTTNDTQSEMDTFTSMVLKPDKNTENQDSDSDTNSESSESDIEIALEIKQGDTDDETKKKREAIIRKLLSKFNLEETISRYRCLDPRQYRMHESEFSSSSASANSRVKQRLERLMGTDIVKLNDKKYMQKLERNIQQEYEAALGKKEAERVSIEQMRMRRLAVQGLTSDDYDDMGNPKNRKGDKRKRKKVSNDDDSDGELTLSNESRRPAHHSRYQDVTEDTGGQGRRRSSTKGTTTMLQIQEGSKQDDSLQSDRSDLEESEQVHGKKPQKSPKDKYESPLVKEMKHEETVAGLYRIAQQIVL